MNCCKYCKYWSVVSGTIVVCKLKELECRLMGDLNSHGYRVSYTLVWGNDGCRCKLYEH